MSLKKKLKKALSNSKKLQKGLNFNLGCTGCHSSPKILSKINLPNFVGSIQEKT